jgi:hypothetical protein
MQQYLTRREHMPEDEDQKEKMIKRAFSIPPSVLIRLQRLAKRESRSVSAQLVIAIREHLAKEEKRLNEKRDDLGNSRAKQLENVN